MPVQRCPQMREGSPAAPSATHSAARAVPLLVCLLVGAVVPGCGSRRAKPDAPKPEATADSVPVGYGKRSKNDVTGSVGTVSAREIETQRVSRVEELIRGRIAGVEVIPTGNGDYTIRIRGISRLTPGTTEPLFVIDGMQVQAATIGGALSGIAPSDVERIDVLKDAGSLAMYGSQGANGVILITTKRPR